MAYPKWSKEFSEIAEWSLRVLDLKYRFLLCESAAEIMSTRGIAACLEQTVVLEMLEAAIAKGYVLDETVGYEQQYPSADNTDRRRADLAFKDKNSAKFEYVEIKYYGYPDKHKIQGDITKLKSLPKGAQGWLFVYRVNKKMDSRSTLQELLQQNFSDQMDIRPQREFPTRTMRHEEGVCEFCLCRIKHN